MVKKGSQLRQVIEKDLKMEGRSCGCRILNQDDFFVNGKDLNHGLWAEEEQSIEGRWVVGEGPQHKQ